jgi:hypothetical protein
MSRRLKWGILKMSFTSDDKNKKCIFKILSKSNEICNFYLERKLAAFLKTHPEIFASLDKIKIISSD